MSKRKIIPYVSNHAVLRFIERHLNINVESIRELISDACYDAIQEGKSSCGAHDIEFVIEGRTVKTCLPKIKDRKIIDTK
jgi:hypothetical protein